MSKRPYTIRGTERFASKPFRKTGTTAGLREAGIEVEATFDEGIDAIPRAMQDLPPAPLTAAARVAVYDAGLARAAVLANLEPREIATLAPPIEEMLP